jgi:hypothetical protein
MRLPALLLCTLAAFAQTPDTVFLEELTWTEVRDSLSAGRTTLIIPTGGTEQNGPHMVLGKHNFRIRHTSNRIACQLGNALVAPVMAYVPEGGLNPPEGHMNYAGTITLPDEVFRKVLEYAARSARLHGFKNIVRAPACGCITFRSITGATDSMSGWRRRANRKRPSAPMPGFRTPPF